MSLSMAEKMINNQQQQQLQAQSSSASQNTIVTTKSGSSLTVPSKTHETLTTSPSSSPNVESLSKKIIGGIKLPFFNSSSSSSSHSSSAEKSQAPVAPSSDSKDFVVPQRLDLAAHNSKSKRPISTQMFDASPVASPTGSSTDVTTISGNQPNVPHLTPSKEKEAATSPSASTKAAVSTSELMSRSTSNENIVEDLSDEENETAAAKNAASKTTPGGSVPVPAPRKARSAVKSFLGSLVNATATPAAATVPASSSSSASSLNSSSYTSISTSPPKNMRRLNIAINEESSIADYSLEANITESGFLVVTGNNNASAAAESSENGPKQLEHLNKSRPRRPNVKRPTVNNPHAKIEIEIAFDSLQPFTASPEHAAITQTGKTESQKENKNEENANKSVNAGEESNIGLNINTTTADTLVPPNLAPKPVSPVLKNAVEQPKVR